MGAAILGKVLHHRRAADLVRALRPRRASALLGHAAAAVLSVAEAGLRPAACWSMAVVESVRRQRRAVGGQPSIGGLLPTQLAGIGIASGIFIQLVGCATSDLGGGRHGGPDAVTGAQTIGAGHCRTGLQFVPISCGSGVVLQYQRHSGVAALGHLGRRWRHPGGRPARAVGPLGVAACVV